MPKLRVIYTPSGRAGEYANHGYACNCYRGCPHGCAYCFNALTPWNTKEQFHRGAAIKMHLLEKIESDLEHMGVLGEPIFFSFACDPYPPEEDIYRIMRPIFSMVHKSGNRLRILTKNGPLAQRDFDLYLPGDEFGVTLTFNKLSDSLVWEPKASTPQERVTALYEANARGIKTWVSFEPVINANQVFELIDATESFVDVYKVGVLNYANKLSPELQARIPGIDWSVFGHAVKNRLRRFKGEIYLKEDLLRRMSEVSE